MAKRSRIARPNAAAGRWPQRALQEAILKIIAGDCAVVQYALR
jgi:hypothetical protein